MNIMIKLETDGAQLPTKSNDTDAGWDLYYDGSQGEQVIIRTLHRELVSTGFSTKIDDGWFAMIKDRSGNAVKRGLHVLAGVIDPDYLGKWKVCLVNLGEESIVINKGDRIAQAVILPVPIVNWYKIEKLEETLRNTDGFGSTGD
jgi:dUTP pyrophosphatase